MLSAIVLAKNEEERLGTCLESLKAVADEVLVVDDESTDNTMAVAQKFGAQVQIHRMENFAAQRNFGLSYTKGDWIFYLDADERVSAPLAAEIKEVIKTTDGPIAAYAIPRCNFYLGKLQKSGWYPDYQKRLFRRDAFRDWVGLLHEEPRFAGALEHLQAPIIHLSHRDIYSMTRKSIQFTHLEAELRLAAKHPPVSWWRLLRICMSEFLRQLRLGRWKNGTEGWIEVLFQTFNMFLIYARLWELQRKEPLAETYQRLDQELVKGGFKL